MKFTITNSSMWINDEEKQKYEKYGLRFRPSNPEYLEHGPWQQDWEREQKEGGLTIIEINTLEELMDLVKDVQNIVLKLGSIEIYDDYRE